MNVVSKYVSVLLVGIGGYGAKYVEYLLKEGIDHGAQIVGAVDPQPNRSKFHETLINMKIPVFEDLNDFYTHHRADLVVISSPIHFHCEQTCLSLEQGSNVLCEKPAAATVSEVERMIEYRDRFKRHVMIGFQWAYDPTFLRLKEDISNGKFGKPVRLKTMVLWPRDSTYYTRSSWAGRLKVNDRWVLDSVANNATAHFLHGMLFVLGNHLSQAASPQTVQAELYRANKIESFDTCCMRILVKDVEILFYATHACKQRNGPYFVYEFEKAKIVFGSPNVSDNKLVAFYKDGKTHNYGAVDHGSMGKLWHAIETAKGKEVVICSLESALSHTLVINAAHRSSKIINFPEKIIKTEQELVYVEGIDTLIEEAFESNKLFSELGLPWAQEGKVIHLDDFQGTEDEGR
ncbi:Gfo/Idh/MocA family protein [Pseudothermotoga sp. U03pept]|uniref:Gfo/Idh/MocA family protein n=1 Tax=Pseudothermotoga sp. U03pept TaxID=3447012 RepID=UPI003F00C3CE